MVTSCLTLGSVAVTLVSLHVLRVLYRVLYPFVVSRFLSCSTKKMDAVKEMGNWAVITGATDGIGKAFAFHLADRGFNLLLLSRSSEKLGTVAGEIGKLHKIDVRTCAIDFSTGDMSETGPYGDVARSLTGVKVGVLGELSWFQVLQIPRYLFSEDRTV